MQGKHDSDCSGWHDAMLYMEVILYLLCVFPTDLNNDGCLTYKDFLWAKDKICYMSGWKIDSPKYKITEALFHEIWESLEIIADVDKDGKITKTEWVIKAFHLRCSTFTSSYKSRYSIGLFLNAKHNLF